MKVELYIEYNGEQTDHRTLIDMAKETWKSEGLLVKDIETLNLYYKPEERSCYCVINGENKGCFQI